LIEDGKGQDLMNDIELNIRIIKDKIASAALNCGRSAEEITLLAISKTFPKESIDRAISSGLLKFGESRIQEAEDKILQFDKSLNLEWHLVGHLQSNKARQAVELFDLIHSVDSTRIAAKLNQASMEVGRILPVLLEVNLGGEETKSGMDPSQIGDLVEAFSSFKNLRLDGLMAIPPYLEDPGKIRPYFARLNRLGEMLESEKKGCLGKRHLSMGMSHDFEAAIQEGATIVRIGTAIFGSR
jgi:PLP dependent protein